MKALIVDDEYKAREILELMLGVHAPEILEIKSAGSGAEATEILATFEPDLVFLDIKMPEMNGFDWLASLDRRQFDVIFATAYDQYAIQAIRFAAFDYLLKPIDPEDLKSSVDRFKSKKNLSEESFDHLIYNINQKDPKKHRLTISTLEQSYFLNPDDIVYCRADGNYTHFYLKDGEHIMASKPIGHYAGLLPESDFIRSHKSYLVNLLCIKSIAGSRLILEGDHKAEVSRRRLTRVKDILSQQNA